MLGILESLKNVLSLGHTLTFPQILSIAVLAITTFIFSGFFQLNTVYS